MKGAAVPVVFAFVGCSLGTGPRGPASAECVETTQAPLIHGDANETFLGLAPAEIRAIVQVVDGDLWRPGTGDPSGGVCSGTFVAPAWVVTARHCLQIQSIAVAVEGGTGTSWTVLPVTRAVASPDVDVALLQVDTSAGSDAGAIDAVAGIASIAPGGATTGDLAVGDVVEVAGYGITENRTVGDLRFLTEAISDIDPSTIIVDGRGASGACEGDSGGPLLLRGPDGAARVAAILAIGSDSCTGTDEYVRLDAIQAWVQATVGPVVPGVLDCGSISSEGRCLYGSAIWCSDARLAGDHCASGTQCGWDPRQAGFRCVDPASDPCEGVGSVGTCRDGAALSCTQGTLRR
jgi:hypothetical protein